MDNNMAAQTSSTSPSKPTRSLSDAAFKAACEFMQKEPQSFVSILADLMNMGTEDDYTSGEPPEPPRFALVERLPSIPLDLEERDFRLSPYEVQHLETDETSVAGPATVPTPGPAPAPAVGGAVKGEVPRKAAVLDDDEQETQMDELFSYEERLSWQVCLDGIWTEMDGATNALLEEAQKSGKEIVVSTVQSNHSFRGRQLRTMSYSFDLKRMKQINMG